MVHLFKVQYYCLQIQWQRCWFPFFGDKIFWTKMCQTSVQMPGFVNYKKGCTRLAAASDKVYQLLAHGRWFSPSTQASSTTKTGRHDIAEILLKVALNTINQIKSIKSKFDITIFISLVPCRCVFNATFGSDLHKIVALRFPSYKNQNSHTWYSWNIVNSEDHLQQHPHSLPSVSSDVYHFFRNKRQRKLQGNPETKATLGTRQRTQTNKKYSKES